MKLRRAASCSLSAARRCAATVTETLDDHTFLDFGGPLVRNAGFIMALHSAAMCRLVALVRMLGVFGCGVVLTRRMRVG